MVINKDKYLESKSLSILLFVFLFLLYAVVYMTKSMFSSAMATIVEEGVMTKSQTGFINAVFWFVYALFQIIGGFAADKYSPHKLIIIGVSGAILSNLIIYFNNSYPVIIAAWSFNAAIQFGIWPGVFKIVSTQLEPNLRATAVFWMLFATSVGLGVSMLLASFVNSWQDNFLISMLVLILFLILYIIIYRYCEKRMVVKEFRSSSDTSTNVKVEKYPMIPLLFSSGLIVLMVVCLFRTAVDNGIKMLTPVMLMESYEQLPAALSTRLSSILIIFSALAVLLTGFVKGRITRCEVKAQIILYSLSLLPLIAVCFIGKLNYIIILVALSVAVMFVHSAAPFGQSFIVLNYGKYGRIGTVSGILNATSSIGNVAASYVFAKMSEYMSWQTISVYWVVIVAVSLAFCIMILPRWTKFKQS